MERARPHSARRNAIWAALAATVVVITGGCEPTPARADQPPTLDMTATAGGPVAMQNGIPVPSFERQPRPTIDLGGEWRVEIGQFDVDVALTDRARSLAPIVEEAGGRELPEFDDSSWPTMRVPGALNPPPERREEGAWLRRQFHVPAGWTGLAATLKFAAVNYLADVWLNGRYLGYHEGGYTPFAFDAGVAVQAGQENTVAVRVVNPPWGTRNDILPWGLADWWNFGGITRDVWLEAANQAHVVRADVVPHLDGIDLRTVVANRGPRAAELTVRVRIYPAAVDDSNLLEPDPRALIPERRTPFVVELEQLVLEPGAIGRLERSFVLRRPEWWSPGNPALYVLQVDLLAGRRVVDTLAESFGLRRIAVDPARPALLLNARPTTFRGAALHDQRLQPASSGLGTGRPASEGDLLTQLRHAREVNVDLIRAGHTPPNPALLRLTDRLGFAVWSEIPLYHYTPLTFDIALGRGIPQQMLREMALRDMNRPSVLFHGLANESTGREERRAALETLHDIDREIDGTRLTGQAAYAFQPDDPTSEPLDVAGITSYFGVFYGQDPMRDTLTALDVIHHQFPDKPLVVLEFGRWSDSPEDERLQREILEETITAIDARDARRPRGYVAAAVWWTLEDYWTMRPNIDVERFGLFAPDGRPRPAADAAANRFGPRDAGAGPDLEIEPSPPQAARRPVRVNGVLLIGYIGFGLAVSAGATALALGALIGAAGRRRRIDP